MFRFIHLFVLVAFVAGCGAPESTLIQNARIIDGTGTSEFTGAVRIENDRIIEVGNLSALPGEKTIDAGGNILAPGFIDTHSHHAEGIAEYREMLAVVSQGVTTIVIGADGKSSVKDEYGFVPLADLKAQLEAQPVAVNIAAFSPHGSIRYTAMGKDFRRAANDSELATMKELLTDDMRHGALGLSTGLEYSPGIYSETEEVIALAQVAAALGGRYSSHMRDEDDRIQDSIDEVIRIGKEARIPVHISHIKLADKALWGTTKVVLNKLDAARKSGVEVSVDIYPYQYWHSSLSILFPDRDFTNMEAAKFTFERTTDPETLIFTAFEPNPDYTGLSIADIAKILEQDVHTTLLQLTQMSDAYLQTHGKGGDSIIAKGMAEADIVDFMQWQHTNLCSDGGNEGGHPRGYGAFPRFLSRYLTDETGISLETAINKMTGLAATNVGIEERGAIKAGNYADLVLFDPETIADRATFEDPQLVAKGILKVWVNGNIVFNDGATTGLYPGTLVGGLL